MGIPHGHDDRRMPKECLHNIQRDALHGEMRSERVTEGMPRNSSQTCLLAQDIEMIGQRAVVKRSPLCIGEHVTRRFSLLIQNLIEICIRGIDGMRQLNWKGLVSSTGIDGNSEFIAIVKRR